MAKKVTPFFVLIMVIALILYWYKIDERAVALFSLLIIISSIQLYSAVVNQYEPLIRFLLMGISLGAIGVALIGIFGETKALGFFAIEPLVYAHYTKDPNLQLKWKP